MVKRLMVVLFVIAACSNNSGSSPSGSAASGSVAPVAAPPGGAPTAGMALPPAASGGALACDEAMFQKWVGYSKDQAAMFGSGAVVKDAVKVAATGSAAATSELVQAGMQLQEIQKKYGFTQQDVGKLSGLAGAVMGMHPYDNPMVKDVVEMMKKMQADPKTKANADKYFAEADDKAKKTEAQARQKYGDACVDVFNKHAPEVLDIQVANMNAVLGGMAKKK